MNWRKWTSRFKFTCRHQPPKPKRGQLVALAGERRGCGGNGWLADPLAEAGKQQALGKLK